MKRLKKMLMEWSSYAGLPVYLVLTSMAFAAPADNPTPGQAAAPVAGVPYQSSLSDYKPFTEENASSWRMLNEQVTGGGHAGHSMGNMQGMNHDQMKSMPSDSSMPTMEGMDHEAMEDIAADSGKPAMKGMNHDAMKPMQPAESKPGQKMNHDQMKSMPAMDGMNHDAMKDMPAQSHTEEAGSEHQHGAAKVDEPTMPATHKEETQPMKFELIPNAHPLAVHFPITLTLIALLFSLGARLRSQHNAASQLATVGHWSLWIAALSAVIAAMLGWLAYNSVNHDADGHAAMLLHRSWAIPTAGGLVILAILDAWKSRANQLMPWPVLIVLFLLSASVAVTGWLGGEVVYRHGIGVLSLPESEEGTEGHHQDQGAAKGHEHHHETTEQEPAAEHHH
jgi:uncharacterized membrane protein